MKDVTNEDYLNNSHVIPGLTRNPGGYGSNVDLDSGSEAGVTDKKTGRSDRKRENVAV